MTAELLPGASGEAWQLSLPPTSLELAPDTVVNLAATGTPTTYQWRAVGEGNPVTVVAWAKRLPPLADNLPAVLGADTVDAETATAPEAEAPAKATPAPASVRFDVTCSRGWSAVSGDQRCTRTPEAPRKAGKSRH